MVAVLTSVGISAIWCAGLRFIGPALGFVDHPPDGDGLKVHSRPAVALAGPGLLLGTVAGLAVAGAVRIGSLPGLVVLTALGVVDDRFQLPPVVRLGVEAVAAASIAIGWWDQGPVLAVGGAVAVVFGVNAVNLYDGLDMLAGSTGAFGLVIGAVASVVSGSDALLALVMAGALVGFLPFNFHPARVFLGDGGAYLLGGVIAVSAWEIGLAAGGLSVIAALGLFGMFGVDFVVTLLRRLKARKPLFAGDRGHLYDVMIAAGIPLSGVVGRLVAVHAVLAASTAAAIALTPPGVALAIVATLGLGAVAVAYRAATRLSASAALP